MAAPALAQALRLPGSQQEILINLNGGLPGRWIACAGGCSTTTKAPAALLRAGEGGNSLAWDVEGNPERTLALDALRYEEDVRQGPDSVTVLLRSVEPWDGIRLVHRFRVAASGHLLDASLQLPAGVGLRLAAGADLRPPPLPGLGALHATTRAVRVDTAGQASLDGTTPLPAGSWAGMRGRFWSLLLVADEPLTVTTSTADGLPVLHFARPGGDAGPVELRFYGGPVERQALAAAAPVLTEQLYAGPWGPLRWLARGLQGLLEWWQLRVGSWGLAIVLLAVTVSLLTAPLAWLAGWWRGLRNRGGTRPALAAADGRDVAPAAYGRILVVARASGVSPWYTLRGLTALLVLFPVVLAALVMLGEQFALAGARFLWIPDLSLPDRALPFAAPAPFFGAHLNLLPVLALLLMGLAARLAAERSPATDVRRGQRLSLYAVAAVGFMLLYTLPAAMVLYWTTHTAVNVGRLLMQRLLRPAA